MNYLKNEVVRILSMIKLKKKILNYIGMYY